MPLTEPCAETNQPGLPRNPSTFQKATCGISSGQEQEMYIKLISISNPLHFLLYFIYLHQAQPDSEGNLLLQVLWRESVCQKQNSEVLLESVWQDFLLILAELLYLPTHFFFLWWPQICFKLQWFLWTPKCGFSNYLVRPTGASEEDTWPASSCFLRFDWRAHRTWVWVYQDMYTVKYNNFNCSEFRATILRHSLFVY